jgi:hypothetical protein
VPWGVEDSSPADACGEHAIRGRIAPEGGIIVRDCQEYLSWLCAMMHEMHHSVLLAQWSAEVRHTLTYIY